MKNNTSKEQSIKPTALAMTVLATSLLASTGIQAASVWSNTYYDPTYPGIVINMHVVSSNSSGISANTITGFYLDNTSISLPQIDPETLLSTSVSDTALSSGDPWDAYADYVEPLYQSAGNGTGWASISFEVDIAGTNIGANTMYGDDYEFYLYSPMSTPFGDVEYFVSDTGYFTLTAASPVPVPAALWLFGSGLIGLAGIARHKKNA